MNTESGGYMAKLSTQVFFPLNFQELFSTWSRLSNAVLYAGGVETVRNQSKRTPALPQNVISLAKLDELGKIGRSERYLEIGAMVKLNQIINLGKIVPEALHMSLQNIDSPQLRSLVTIGGNLCNPARRLDASAPMIALDAQYELRTSQSSRWISASRFSSQPGPPIIAPHELLTRIRVPLEPWTYTWYRKFTNPGPYEPGGAILLIVKIQKNILTDIRVIYSGLIILREKNSETMLAGKHLPLEKKETRLFLDKWKAYLSVFDGIEKSVFPGEGSLFNPELIKEQILRFIESTLTHISE
jgi:CO/xanthine dehydrogenase FAD-binding subunit